MRTLKIVLLVVALLFVGLIAGCQEGYARQSNSPQWEPTGTGFWRPVVTTAEAK
ncbi:MAG: hypothetical protein ACYS67_00325 [Planctomycetota bacterium]|jgi:hypothetical protein